MRFCFRKNLGFAVCMALVFQAGQAVAGGTQSAPYTQCEVDAEPLQNAEQCPICKTEEICRKEDDAIKALLEAKEVTFYVMDGGVGTGQKPLLGGYDPVESKTLSGDIAREVAGAFRDSLLSGNYFSMCFNPHHALSVKTPDHLYEFLLCYECTQMEIYVDNSYISRIPATDNPEHMNALVLKAGMSLPADYVKQLEWKKVGPP